MFGDDGIRQHTAPSTSTDTVLPISIGATPTEHTPRRSIGPAVRTILVRANHADA
jgi:hypothetical protein